MIEVAAAIIEKDGKILIAKRKKGKHLEDKWEFPGGKIEENETPNDCLERELLEEFGVKTKAGEFVAESVFDYGEGKKIRLSGYMVEYLSGDFLLNDHSEIAWVKAEDFYDYDFAPADLPIVAELRKRDYWKMKSFETTRPS